MDDLRTRIAAVVRQHPQSDEWGIPQEECRNCKPFYGMDYAQHVADAVIAELKTERDELVKEAIREKLGQTRNRVWFASADAGFRTPGNANARRGDE